MIEEQEECWKAGAKKEVLQDLIDQSSCMLPPFIILINKE